MGDRGVRSALPLVRASSSPFRSLDMYVERHLVGMRFPSNVGTIYFLVYLICLKGRWLAEVENHARLGVWPLAVRMGVVRLAALVPSAENYTSCVGGVTLGVNEVLVHRHFLGWRFLPR